MSDKPFRVLPAVDDTNRHFWTSGADGVLRVLRCSDCGFWVHPPAPRCPQCTSKAVSPQDLSGRATVVSYTVNYQPWNPTMPDRYAIALVELEEQAGMRLMTQLVDIDPDEVAIGMPVQVVFEQHDEVGVPLFAPASVAAAS